VNILASSAAPCRRHKWQDVVAADTPFDSNGALSPRTSLSSVLSRVFCSLLDRIDDGR
jgi:hypothetical protein